MMARMGYADESGTIHPEGVTPPHLHVFEVADDDDTWESQIIGFECNFTWLIVPGPRGKKPRPRICGEFIELEQAAAVLTAIRAKQDGEA